MLSCLMKAYCITVIKAHCIVMSIMRERWTEQVRLLASDTAFILQINLMFTIKH